MSIPQGPLIPGSSLLLNNQTINMYIGNTNNNSNIVSQLRTNSLKVNDGPTLENGLLRNVISPVTSSSIVNKGYIDNLYVVLPAQVDHAVQFNTAGSFNGDTDLTFVVDESIGILNINGSIVSGASSLSNGIITGLASPTNDSDAITKVYADTINKKTVTQISGSGSYTYSAAQIVNCVIFRIGLIVPINTSTTFTDIAVRNVDYLPSASSIFAQLLALGITPVVGTVSTLNLLNVNTNGSVSLVLSASTSDVIIEPESVPIYGGYQMSARLVVISVSPPTVLVHIDTNNYISQQTFVSPGLNVPLWATLLNNQGLVSTTYRTDTQMILPMNPVEYSTIQREYTYSDIAGKLIIRNLISNTTDTIVDITTFLDNTFFTNYTSGLGMEFAIQNISSFTLSLGESSGWTIFGNAVIPSNKTGLFNLFINNTDKVGVIYLIGVFNRY